MLTTNLEWYCIKTPNHEQMLLRRHIQSVRKRETEREREIKGLLTCKMPDFPQHISKGVYRLLVWRCGMSEPVSSAER